MLKLRSVQNICADHSRKEFKPMKNIITVFITIMTLLSLTACGKKDTPSQTTTTTAPSTSQTTQSTAPTTSQTTVPTTGTATEPEKQFEEILLVDNEQVTVKIIGIENDPIWGYTLKAFVENKTDKELMFTVQNVSVNGFMCDPYWAVSVDAGKKSNTSISWLESDLEKNGIDKVEEITFTLRVYDSNDWLADDIVKETFTVKP